jgi:hypothetical protein
MKQCLVKPPHVACMHAHCAHLAHRKQVLLQAAEKKLETYKHTLLSTNVHWRTCGHCPCRKNKKNEKGDVEVDTGVRWQAHYVFPPRSARDPRNQSLHGAGRGAPGWGSLGTWFGQWCNRVVRGIVLWLVRLLLFLYRLI